VSRFGIACKAKLGGPGDREAAIRSPLEALLAAAGEQFGLQALFHDEVRDEQRRVRPDYGVSIGGAIIGYVEVKAPGHGIDPAGFTGHDKVQWERQRDLPNLLYTNGMDWRLYRDGQLLSVPVELKGGSLDLAGNNLAPAPDFEEILTDFLRWKPAPIISVAALVRAIAPLTRLLRGEVLDQLAAERRAIKEGADPLGQPFLGLARDWRSLLFPQASDKTFADGYAQAVTFALLLARTEGIDVGGMPLHEVGTELGSEHSLMGKALQLLTDDVAADFKVTLDLLVRVIGAVDWPKIRRGRRDAYLHLYEHFLELYDNELRKASGSYYTPHQVVDPMVRLTEAVLQSRLHREIGFRDPGVLTVDPAMGTGTYLQTILEHVAKAAELSDGPGAIPGAVSDVAQRLVGFELQMGPYAVAELRTTDLLASRGATAPASGMRLYVTDTLDDPYADQIQLSYALQMIAKSRRNANIVKARDNVTVVIGNPPYGENAGGKGGWIEHGDESRGLRPPFDAFRIPGDGVYVQNLKNLYVYFWRWATWKVWESTPALSGGEAGIVCFISTSAYLQGPGFRGMRQYLRRYASEGWIIDLTPEGQTPDVPTRIFPGVRQPLAIGLFVRTQETDSDIPADIHYRAVSGRQAQKFEALAAITIDDDGWRDTRTAWTAPLTPAAAGAWDTFPALSDLLPWTSSGVTPNRTWVHAPSAEILKLRWDHIVAEPNVTTKRELFKESASATLEAVPDPLPGTDTYRFSGAFVREHGHCPTPVRVGYRSFDRQWLIPDSRLMHRPRRNLWAARRSGQLFVVEQHSKQIKNGPGIVFSALIPDSDYFKGSGGGRVLPFLHPDGSPNLAPGLVAAVGRFVGVNITELNLLAYLAATISHPAYERTFADELVTPGIRLPITKDPDLWSEAVMIGDEVIWAQTYGEISSNPELGRPKGNIRFAHGDPRQPLALQPVTGLPETMSYDPVEQILRVGTSRWGPVRAQVSDYAVDGKNILKSWFNYRKADPGGRKTSPLDYVNASNWSNIWTTELVDLLTVLTRLVEIEPHQEDLLSRILDSELATLESLSTLGARWPRSSKDRLPHFAVTLEDFAGMPEDASGD
jgi:hypothetical protein